MEYYIAIDKEDIIWGHGLTKSEALKEGRNYQGYERSIR